MAGWGGADSYQPGHQSYLWCVLPRPGTLGRPSIGRRTSISHGVWLCRWSRRSCRILLSDLTAVGLARRSCDCLALVWVDYCHLRRRKAVLTAAKSMARPCCAGGTEERWLAAGASGMEITNLSWPGYLSRGSESDQGKLNLWRVDGSVVRRDEVGEMDVQLVDGVAVVDRVTILSRLGVCTPDH